MEIVLYHRPYCHLCDVLYQALEPLAVELALTVTRIDVDSDPRLEERYGSLVPVLVADGREICRYHLDEAALRRAVKRAKRSTPGSPRAFPGRR